jgi:D-3-phosphoglycerate dehydrogenase
MKMVVISKAIPQAAMDILAGKVDPVVLPDSSVETAKRLAPDVEGMIFRSNIKVTQEIMNAAPSSTYFKKNS